MSREQTGFEWHVPERFNFATDVVDRFAADRGHAALYWEDESGRRARWTFWDFSRASRRLANALSALGVRRGDPVLVMLPRIPEWQVAMLAVLRAGAIAIPCTTSLRAKDVAYRAGHSAARGVVTTARSRRPGGVGARRLPAAVGPHRGRATAPPAGTTSTPW